MPLASWDEGLEPAAEDEAENDQDHQDYENRVKHLSHLLTDLFARCGPAFRTDGAE